MRSPWRLGAPRLRLAWHYATADGVPRRAFWVAVVVGTILNLINQGDAIVAGGPVNIVKLLLTYGVPYGVATYGAVSFRLHSARSSQPEIVRAPSSELSDG